MSQQGMRTFSTEFKQAVVLRLEAGERIAAVAEALKIRRKLLYEWRASYRELGAAGLNRKRGPKPDDARASPDAAPGREALTIASSALLAEPDMRARIRLFGSVHQSASESWADATGGLRSRQRALSETRRPVNQAGG